MPTSSVPAYRPGDVVVVPFPYSDRLAEKRRPALVISGRTLASAGFVWVAMITSAANQPMQHDQPISDPRRAGLSAPSVVRPVKMACIEPGRILRRAGRLSAAESAAVLETIVGFVG
ncbi:MAG: type II toxin-antitoxin system PemK/MazF family toxin [Alphaproteobacteria bacterium]